MPPEVFEECHDANRECHPGSLREIIYRFFSGLPVLARQRQRNNTESQDVSGSNPASSRRLSFSPSTFNNTKRRASVAQSQRRLLSRRSPRRDARRGSRVRRRSSVRPPNFTHPIIPPPVTRDPETLAPPEDTLNHNPIRRISRILSNAGPALVRQLSQLRRKSVAHPEFEDIELAPLRYRPVCLDQLCKATKFTKEELQFMYRGFKQECPTGVISEETFKSVYGKFFPICGLPDDGSGRNTPMYAHYVFGTMDHEGTGHITFGEFIMGLSVLLKGSLQERINWVFNLYDINNDGYITKEELVDIVTSIYDLMGDDAHPTIDDIDAVEHVEKLFDKLDLNRDGVVTIDEFMEYCLKNEDVIASMNSFNKV